MKIMTLCSQILPTLSYCLLRNKICHENTLSDDFRFFLKKMYMGVLLVRLHTLKPPHISVESIISHFTAKAWQKQRPTSASHQETCKLSLGSSARPFFLVKGCTQTQSRLGSIPGPRWLLSFILDIGGD